MSASIASLALPTEGELPPPPLDDEPLDACLAELMCSEAARWARGVRASV